MAPPLWMLPMLVRALWRRAVLALRRFYVYVMTDELDTEPWSYAVKRRAWRDRWFAGMRRRMRGGIR